MALDTPADAPSSLAKYELLKEQAEGGYGTTWIARSDESGDPPPLYSVLRVHRHLFKKPEAAELFVAEIRKDLSLASPTLVATIDAGIDDGEIFVVSQYVEGESLAALIAAAGAEGLPTPIALRILLDVLAAVAAGHALEKPVIHGEIGPQHIRVGVDGVARIGGFGVARALAKLSVQGAKNHDRLAYAAPERVKSMASTTAPQVALEPRADVFSLGVLLWEAIARQRLFASRIEAAVIQKVLTAPIAGLAGLPGVVVPPRMDELVQRALERDPARRSSSAVELWKGLEGAGSSWVASHGEVAAQLEKLVGKAVAERRMDLAAALGRTSSTTGLKAQSAPGASAVPAVPKPAAAVLRPIAAPARPAPAKPVPAPTTLEKPAATPAAPPVRSVPNRHATMLGGLGAKSLPVAAPIVEAPKPEPAAVDPLQAANDDWDLSLSDDALEASTSAPIAKPVVNKAPGGLRSQTVRGGFDPKPFAPAAAEPSRGIDVPPAAAGAAPALGVRAITKPRAGQDIPLHEASASASTSTEEAATKITTFAAEDFEPPAGEPAPRSPPAKPPVPRSAATPAAPPAALAPPPLVDRSST
ncbi:MAG: protein kinase, partial [Minicystis sp.]